MLARPKRLIFYNRFLLVALGLCLALAATGQTRPISALAPITVDDAIGMTRLGDSDYFTGTPAKGRVAHFSPDGKYFLVLLRKGNLQHNSNDFSLILFRTVSAFQSPKPEKLLEFSSTSNRNGISNIKWLNDDTVSFIGSKMNEAAQVFTFNIKTHRLTKVTNHATSISDYDMTKDGREVLYLSDPPTIDHIPSEQEDREGIVITTQTLSEILGGATITNRSQQLFLQKRGCPPVHIPLNDYLYKDKGGNFISLSPNGQYAIIRSWARGDVPQEWAEYQSSLVHLRLKAKRRIAELNTGLMRFLILDTKSGSLSPLVNTPMEWFNETATWSADSQSLFLTTRLSLDAGDPSQREDRKKNFYDVEIRLPSRQAKEIRALDFDTMMEKEIERRGRSAADVPIDIVLVEDINTPPKIYAWNRDTHQRALLLDLNPQFANFAFGKVETVEWSSEGFNFVGGLYLPTDYSSGKRYPLVIQTHGFSPGRFSMDGSLEWSSGFAARPLAASGFVVLQTYALNNPQGVSVTDSSADKRFGANPEQSGRRIAQIAYESAVDELARRGIIDRSRVGISGFSRTVAFVAYTLTHSKYQFGAAILTDGTDGGYFQELVFPNAAWDLNAMNGGVSPFGEGLTTWLTESPSFNLDKVHTPVRLVAIGKGSTLELWEWFSGLALQNKPVDLVEIPDGIHLLERPSDRRIAMQGMVDWFRFWLKDEQDLNPAIGDQYRRWQELKLLGKTMPH